MKLRDMLQNKAEVLFSITEDVELAAAANVLAQNRIGALVVLDEDGKLQGILSERDISKAFGAEKAEAATKLVSSVMTKSVITCHPDHEIGELFRSMVDNNIRHLPVVQNGRPTGMISIRDISRALVQKYESDIQDLKNVLISLNASAA